MKGSSYDSKDWILDTECSNEEVLQGTQVIARLSIEPIAGQLRREGVTEMFTYVQHEPLGTSLLVPAAQDTYVDNELRWYLSTLPLSNPPPDLLLTYGFAPEKTLPGQDRIQVARLPGILNPTIPWGQSIRTREPNLSPQDLFKGVERAREQLGLVIALR